MAAPITEPELVLLRYAVGRGLVTRARGRELLLAREALTSSGRPAPLAALLVAGVPGAARADLEGVWGRALAAHGAPPAPLPGLAPVPPEVVELAARLARRPPAEDPPGTRDALARLGDGAAANDTTLAEGEAPAQAASAAPRESAQQGVAAGERLGGHLRVERELGRGGMGVVFLARDERLDRAVAVKLMLGQDARALARFEAEARAMARVRHPNVVQIHEVGAHDGAPYLVVDFVDGESLAARLTRAGPVDPREAARLGAAVARGLEAAHAQGVLHRDVKPANVLLDRDGAPRLADFGLARATDREALTRTGQLLGTLHYMAPEQAAAGVVDARADVYGLGATLYHAITGVPPFSGEGLQLLFAVRSERPLPPSARRPGLDPVLDGLLLRCLEKDPAARPASAAALADALDACAGQASIPAAPPRPAQRPEAAPRLPLPVPGASTLPCRFGQFTLERELGRGGMGAVFQAHHPGLDRKVALKMLLGWDARHHQRFQVEARTAARLRHPNIAGVHEVGVEQGQRYLVMDLIEGESLSARLARGGPLDPEEAVRIAACLARALHYAHGKGVLHRDLKPSNVLVDAEGEPVLTDFGLAKDTTAGGESLTKTGQTLGTLSYMPPEQVTGKKGLDARSDVYSLGATLFEALTGSVPFVAESPMQVAVAILGQDAPSPSSLRAGLDPALDALVQRCLAKAPAERPPTAGALADALQAWLDACASGGAARPRAALAVATAVLAIAGGAAAGATWILRTGAGTPAPTVSSPDRAVLASGGEASAVTGAGGLDVQGADDGSAARDSALDRATAADAHGWSVAAEEARWEALRADPAHGPALAGVVRARLAADDAVGLSRLWAEVHRRVGDAGAPPLLLELRADEEAVAATLAGPAPPGARLRAALAAARHRRPGVTAALRAVATGASDPLLAEAARSTLLATEQLDLSRWVDQALAAGSGLEGAPQALTLLEQAARPGPGMASALARLGREARAPLLRAAVPLAVALAATRASGIPADEALALLGECARDSDPFVAARARAAAGALAALRGEDPRASAGPTCWGLARDLLALPLAGWGDRGVLRAALLRGAERGATPWALVVMDALEAGDAAAARQALARCQREPLGVELGLQLRLLADDAGADPEPRLAEAAGGDPGAAAQARERLEFVRRYGLPALPAPNGALRIVLAPGAPWGARGLARAFDTLATQRPGGAHVLDTDGPIFLRSLFCCDEWHVVHVEGTRRPEDGLWLAFDAADELEVETGVRAAVISGVASVAADGVQLGSATVPAELELRAFTLALRRAEVALLQEGVPLLTRALPARLARGQGRVSVDWSWGAGSLDGVVLEGRWDPRAETPDPPSDAEVLARLARLVPLGGATRLVAEQAQGTPLDLTALRRDGLRLEARGQWVAGSRRADLVAIPGLRGDLEVRARLRLQVRDGVQAGLALRSVTPWGDVLWFGLTGTEVEPMLLASAQRLAHWDRPLQGGRWPQGALGVVTLSFARLGDHLVLRAGVGDEPLRPFLVRPLRFPLVGALDACLFARNYPERAPFPEAAFDQVEVFVSPE